MEIIKRRIFNLSNYMLGIGNGEVFYIGKKINNLSPERIGRSGFSYPVIIGEQILPSAVGSISRYNAYGKSLIHKDLPMETVYRDAYITDWHGYDHFVDIPYKRHPRTSVIAPAEELLMIDHNRSSYIVSHQLVNSDECKDRNVFIINLFLELYGSCEIFKKDLTPILSTLNVRRVNWEILPVGEYPFERTKSIVIKTRKPNNRKLCEARLKELYKYSPDYIANGKGGFTGYVVFAFTEKNLFVLENFKYGNATYVFENTWEQFSQLTKAEIIQNQQAYERIVHDLQWPSKIRHILT